MNFVRNLALGSEFIPDRKVYKYAKLRVNFCIAYIGVALFYISFDSYNKFYGFIPLYLVIIATAFICLIVNRYKRYDLANGLAIVLSNLIIYLFADSDDPYGGLFFYFLGAAMAAMILFSYERRHLAFSFVALSIVLGILAFTVDLNLITLPVIQDNAIIRITFLINFILATLTCTFIVFFLIKENHHAENVLQEKQIQLRQTAVELKRSNEQLEMALKGTRAGIYEWNVNENSIYVSPYWKELLGFSESELPQITLETFVSFIHPEDTKRISQKIQEVLQSHQPYQNELRIRTKARGYKWFLDSGMVKTDSKGNTYFVIGTLMDIDDRKKSEREITLKNSQLAKTNEELDRFVYSASHDMRAPLSSLLGLINLSEKTDKIEELRTFTGMMKDRIKVMEGFIKEVTDYSRNTRLDLALTNFSLSSLTKEVINHLAYTHVNKKLRIEVNIAPDHFIISDPSRVKVVLNNLLSNAYKYHRWDIENPYILIGASQVDGQTLVRVEDNGRGISEEHHHRIFDMFYRASENSEGSGLGLYIVKETLEKLGGDISVQSEIGVGSTFTFSLPILG